MADHAKGPPGNIGDSKSFQVTIPKHHYDYMTLLARKSRLGLKESDVAAHILIRELDRMFQGGYHEKEIPQV